MIKRFWAVLLYSTWALIALEPCWADQTLASQIFAGKNGDQINQVAQQIEKGIELQKAGLYRRANQLLTETAKSLSEQPDSQLKLTALLNLANSLRISGNLDQAEQILIQAQSLAQSLSSESRSSESLSSEALSLIEAKIYVLIGLGDISKAKQNWIEAERFYDQAEKLSCDRSNIPSNNYKNNGQICLANLQAKLEQLNLIALTSSPKSLGQNSLSNSVITPKNQIRINQLSESILFQINQLKDSTQAIYARIYLAESLIKLSQSDRAIQILTEVLPTIKSSSDRRSYALLLGTLGQAEEQNQQWKSALNHTQNGLAIAQSISAYDLSYQWQWQLGRIYLATADKSQAISAYREAYQSLQMLRRDLAALPSNTQFSFRQVVEPVYRQYIDLLISSDRPTSQSNLIKARQVSEALQLAELENFLRQACLDLQPQDLPQAIDQIDPTAAVIYPIMLPQRLVVIVSLPGKPLISHSINRSATEVDITAAAMLKSLRPDSFIEERLPPAQTLYDWLIRPVESQLQQSEVSTLVFVLDGRLRNIPMAAIFDGKQYLIQKFNLALNTGLQLASTKSKNLKQSTLFAGLSQKNSGFSALPGVEQELTEIKNQSVVEPLLNQQFTIRNFANQMQREDFGIVHLATHGQFSSKPENTFLLAWNEKINSLQLEQILRSKENRSIELLILSACETASGDDRAVLGLAGMAVKSGASTTIATLWAIQDQSTANFMIQLYQNLFLTNTMRSQALRKAQLSILANPQTRHPYFWSPYILVGNWR